MCRYTIIPVKIKHKTWEQDDQFFREFIPVKTNHYKGVMDTVVMRGNIGD